MVEQPNTPPKIESNSDVVDAIVSRLDRLEAAILQSDRSARAEAVGKAELRLDDIASQRLINEGVKHQLEGDGVPGVIKEASDNAEDLAGIKPKVNFILFLMVTLTGIAAVVLEQIIARIGFK